MESVDRNRLSEFTAHRLQIFYPKTDLPATDLLLRNLRNQSDAELGLTSDVLRAAADAAFRGVTSTVSRLSEQGTFHRLFLARLLDGSQFVMRFTVADLCWFGLTLHLENWAIHTAHAAGVPTPQILLTDTSRRVCPFDFQITSWVKDRTLLNFDHDEPAMTQLLAQYGAVLAKLHSIPVRRFGLFDVRPLLDQPAKEPAGLFAEWRDYLGLQLEAHVDACERINAITHHAASRILNQFACLLPQLSGFQPVLLHGDPGNHNAATDGHRITMLFDWEDCLAGDPVYEIAFWATFHPERRHAGMVDAYRSIQPLPDDFDIRFWLYFLRVALAKTVHRSRFGYEDRPDRPPAAQRINTALDRLEKALAHHS